MPTQKRIFNRHDRTNARTDAQTIHQRAKARARVPNAPAVAVPRKQFITPVGGKSFDAPARTSHGTFLLNLHKHHRDLAQRIADERALQIEFRDDAKKNDGTPDPNRYAVHVVNGPYDREILLAAISDAILRAWTERQNENGLNARAAQKQTGR